MEDEYKCKKGVCNECNQCNQCKYCHCECFVNNPRCSRRYTNQIRSFENMIGSIKDVNLTAINIINEAVVSIPLESILDVKKVLNLL